MQKTKRSFGQNYIHLSPDRASELLILTCTIKSSTSITRIISQYLQNAFEFTSIMPCICYVATENMTWRSEVMNWETNTQTIQLHLQYTNTMRQKSDSPQPHANSAKNRENAFTPNKQKGSLKKKRKQPNKIKSFPHQRHT